ncbi:hypothetical protein GA707_14705 [Nostocoides sp. F2B08]|uniref:nucleotidyltransferase family protein n=1 Tax=Nostocoides sp. F2B08 TaxID=2653936 RepID=UPI0012637751|nr:nucleotidyltransferase family protein [Tetrasphaera sp. F2B08]KAB7743345.1 hypothetical protein GA707_14705 [Tetrasphaera sp. F2B08]
MASRHPALVVASRHGIPVHSRTGDITDGEADRLIHVIRRDRLAGYMATAIAEGAVAAPADFAAAVVDAWHNQLIAAVDLERLLIGVARALDGAGVEWRLTKGPALAHLDFPDPSLRTFGDVDVLIHPDSWDRAVAALAGIGWTRDALEVSPGFDGRFGKGVTLTNTDSLEVDLHRRLAIGRFGLRLDTRALFEGGDEFVLAGRRIPALSGPNRLLHGCFHAALGGWRELRAFRDVAQLMLVSEVDWQQTIATAERFKVQAVVASALIETWDRLELELHHDALTWARGQRIGRLDAHALGVFAREEPFRMQAMTALPVLVGRGALRYAWDLGLKPGRRGRR